MIATVGHRYASEGFLCPGRGYAAALRCRHKKVGAASETPHAAFANLAQTARATASAGPSICIDKYLDVSGWNVILWMRLLTKISHKVIVFPAAIWDRGPAFAHSHASGRRYHREHEKILRVQNHHDCDYALLSR